MPPLPIGVAPPASATSLASAAPPCRHHPSSRCRLTCRYRLTCRRCLSLSVLCQLPVGAAPLCWHRVTCLPTSPLYLALPHLPVGTTHRAGISTPADALVLYYTVSRIQRKEQLKTLFSIILSQEFSVPIFLHLHNLLHPSAVTRSTTE
jgi:hypothetical protein